LITWPITELGIDEAVVDAVAPKPAFEVVLPVCAFNEVNVTSQRQKTVSSQRSGQINRSLQTVRTGNTNGYLAGRQK